MFTKRTKALVYFTLLCDYAEMQFQTQKITIKKSSINELFFSPNSEKKIRVKTRNSFLIFY